jgi:hypothetical protein
MWQNIKSKMSRLRILVDILNWLTGRSIRHNRALRDMQDWAVTVQEFLAGYTLCDSADMSVLLKDSSQANFDLTAMTHKGHLLEAAAARISRTSLAPLLVKVVDDIENTRRVLINPTSRDARLPVVVDALCTSFKKFQEKLSEIDFL